MTEDYLMEKNYAGMSGFDTFVLKSRWNSNFVNIILNGGIVAIELNYAKGFKGENVDFLAEVPFIHGLKIIDYNLKNVKGIHHCKSLTFLEVSTYCKTEINFTEFKRLSGCFLTWKAKATTISRCKTLKNLVIDKFDSSCSDLSLLSGLFELEHLSLLNAKISSLAGISPDNCIEFMGLYNLKNLTSLYFIQNFSKLKKLELDGCKRIGSIEEVKGLDKLRYLSFNNVGRIDSLKPLLGLERLEEVYFYENTNIEDGDLSPLLDLPSLRALSFQDRKHYSHSLSELERILINR